MPKHRCPLKSWGTEDRAEHRSYSQHDQEASLKVAPSATSVRSETADKSPLLTHDLASPSHSPPCPRAPALCSPPSNAGWIGREHRVLPALGPAQTSVVQTQPSPQSSHYLLPITTTASPHHPQVTWPLAFSIPQDSHTPHPTLPPLLYTGQKWDFLNSQKAAHPLPVSHP